MKRWRLHAATLGATAGVAMVFTGVALALTTSELESKATEWQAKTCTAALLGSKAKKTSQEIALCYALAQAQEYKATIANLQSRVTALEAAPPAVIDFTFLSEATTAEGGGITSAIFDAGDYTTVTMTTSSACTEHTIFQVQVSDNDTTWLTQREGKAVSETYAVAGDYYRVIMYSNAEYRSACGSAVARFSD